ncbi:MAG TPA: DUF4412 domain-containing protein [Gemmatimonadales bacterium]
MRRFLAVSCLSFIAAVPLAAQFEGTVNMDMPSQAGAKMSYYIKGNMLAANAAMNNGGAVHEVHMIFDIPNHKMTMFVPMAMQGMKGVKMVYDTRNDTSSSAATTDLKSLGTSETIAGYKCDDVQVIDAGKPAGTICMTHDLGFFAYAMMSGMGKRAASPTWASVFGNKPAFPLKVTDSNGKVVMVATSVQKGPVPADAFTVPDGYQDMSGMAGMMGGRGPQF